MEFLASDVDSPWRFSRTKPTTRETGLKGFVVQ